MPNADLLVETLDHIHDHPETWLQRSFRQGDMGCFAYHAALLAGAELKSPEAMVTDEHGFLSPNPDYSVVCNDAARRLGFTPDDVIDVDRFARRALGLGLGESGELFDPGNDLEDLEALVGSLLDQNVPVT